MCTYMYIIHVIYIYIYPKRVHMYSFAIRGGLRLRIPEVFRPRFSAAFEALGTGQRASSWISLTLRSRSLCGT